jgi:hypothetical protein
MAKGILRIEADKDETSLGGFSISNDNDIPICFHFSIAWNLLSSTHLP